MKIGQEFADTKVIELPMEGMGSASITTNTTYKLIKVTDDIADLTTKVSLSGTMSMMGQEIPLNGAGSGTMSIDLKQQYSPSSNTTIDQELAMELQGMTVEQKVRVSVITKTQKVK